MKKTSLFVFILFLCSFLSAKDIEKPEWVDSWRQIYPDSVYIAQLGKASGKNASNEAKTVAANTLAQYIQTTVQSEITSSLKTYTGQNKKGRLVTSQEKENSQDISLSVNLSLTSLEYTEPWYNKKEKVWYCVAYAEREKLWEQYRPTLQNARDRLFSFYDIADKSQEPLYKMLIYMQSMQYEEDFLTAYSFASILSSTLTKQNYSKDRNYISSVTALAAEEKNKCTFRIQVDGDMQNIIYQCIKDEFSKEGYNIQNDGESALYSIVAKIFFDDTIVNSVHVIKPTVEIIIVGKTKSFFSYAKQQKNTSGLNVEIAKSKAVRSLADELQFSLMQEFNEKLTNNTKDDLLKIFK